MMTFEYFEPFRKDIKLKDGGTMSLDLQRCRMTEIDPETGEVIARLPMILPVPDGGEPYQQGIQYRLSGENIAKDKYGSGSITFAAAMVPVSAADRKALDDKRPLSERASATTKAA